MQRADDFASRRKEIANLSDAELEARFWQLAEAVLSPLIELAKQNTSPSVERSVLLRMGFNSLDANGIVQAVSDHGLLSKGAGHVVYALVKTRNCSVRDAGELLLRGEGWDAVTAYFQGGGHQ